MVWRAKDEIHLLKAGTDSNGNPELDPLAFVRTFTRVRVDNDFGFDAEVGISKFLPKASDPKYRITVEGLWPNEPTFLTMLDSASAFMIAPPVTDPNYANMYDYISNDSPTSDVQVGPAVVSYGIKLDRLDINLDDSGLGLTAEFAVPDVAVGTLNIVTTTDANGNIVVSERNFTASAEADRLWMAQKLLIPEGQNQTVLEDPYDPAVARATAGGVLVVKDNLGNDQTLRPTSLRIRLDWNAQVTYTRDGYAVVQRRLYPQVSIEITPLPTEELPLQFAKVGRVNLGSTPVTMTITNAISIDLYEYVVQTDTFEVSDGYPSPSVTVIPLRYVVKDGAGNSLVGVV